MLLKIRLAAPGAAVPIVRPILPSAAGAGRTVSNGVAIAGNSNGMKANYVDMYQLKIYRLIRKLS